MRLNLARTLRKSAANGPGERFVIWVQGCPLACPGCWNPDTWAFEDREIREVPSLIEEILGVDGIEGVTFSGGEPFMQARGLAELARALRRGGLSILVFSGYTLEELVWDAARELLSLSDVLVAGRYIDSLKSLHLPWRGSANQRVHFLSGRYGPEDMEEAADVEIRIGKDGGLVLTGFPEGELLSLHEKDKWWRSAGGQ